MPELFRAYIGFHHPLIRDTELVQWLTKSLYDFRYITLSVITRRSRPKLNSRSWVNERFNSLLHIPDIGEPYIVRRYGLFTLDLKWINNMRGATYHKYPIFISDRVLMTTAHEETVDFMTDKPMPTQLTILYPFLIEFLKGQRPEDKSIYNLPPSILADWLQDRDQYQDQAWLLRGLIQSTPISPLT